MYWGIQPFLDTFSMNGMDESSVTIIMSYSMPLVIESRQIPQASSDLTEEY
jgi:hypothetical protein